MSEAAHAAQTAFALFAGAAYDPTAAGGRVAWQRPDGVALLQGPGGATGLPGTHPALGGGRIAWREGDAIVLADAATLAPATSIPAPGAGALALSDAALVWRTRDEAGTDRLWAWAGEPRLLLESAAPTELGRPALAGATVLCHRAGPRGSRLLALDVPSGAVRTLRRERGAQLTNPVSDGSRLLYVHATGRQQELRVGALAPAATRDDRVVLVHASPGRRDREHEPGRHRHRQGYRGRRPPLPPRASPGATSTLWTTALTPDTALVTRLRFIRGEGRTADILSVPAPG